MLMAATNADGGGFTQGALLDVDRADDMLLFVTLALGNGFVALSKQNLVSVLAIVEHSLVLKNQVRNRRQSWQ